MAIMTTWRLALLLFVAAAAALATAQEKSSTEDTDVAVPGVESESQRLLESCAALGFDAEALDCRQCQELQTFLEAATSGQPKAAAAQSVVKECRQCCADLVAQADATGGPKYARAVLAMSPRKLKRYPKVANFVHNHAQQYTRLEVKEVGTRHPYLQFFDERGVKMEETSISHWDEDTIAEFIQTKLTPEATEDALGVESAPEEQHELLEVEVEADTP